jgi:hypothetical protein
MPSPRTTGQGTDLAAGVKPGPDVYIGLLLVSLLAQVVACLFLWMDYSQYPESKPPKVANLPPIGQSAPAAPAPAAAVPPAAAAPPGAAAPGPPAPGTAAPAPATPAPATPAVPPKKG